jgi:acyl dehydratase
MRLRDALRHILLGGLIAAGMGSLSMAVIAAWLGLRPDGSYGLRDIPLLSVEYLVRIWQAF